MFWIERTTKPTPLEYYLYRSSESSSPILGPRHPLLTKGLRSLYRLPSTQGDGFAFCSGDNDRRWTLKYDYEYGEEGVSQERSLLLKSHSSWDYASENVSIIADAFQEFPTVIEPLGVFAENVPQGVVLQYLAQNAHEGIRLLWTGDSIRDFKIAQILPNGRILIKKNRDLIVLQLMKGNKPVCFETLVNSEQS